MEEGHASGLTTIRVSFRDVMERRAYVRLPPEARIRLCHKAGAPWNDKAPEADLHDLQQEVLRRREREKIVHGASRLGKALDPDTPILTAGGWRAIGSLQPGDVVFDENGATCKVVATRRWKDRPCYRLTLDSGESIVADENHEWLTHDAPYRHALARRKGTARYGARKASRGSRYTQKADYALRPQCRPRLDAGVRTTREVSDSLYTAHGNTNHAVPMAEGIRRDPIDLPIPPYTLGAWLGDGTSRSAHLTNEDRDAQIAEEVEAEGVPVTKMRTRGSVSYYRLGNSQERGAGGRYRCRGGSFFAALREQGLIRNKHIPAVYFAGSFGQRLSLLQGLMDTDGWIMPSGTAQFTSTSAALAEGVVELARGLGLKAHLSDKPAKLYGKSVGTAYNVTWTSTIPVFRLARKLARIPDKVSRKQAYHYFVEAEPAKRRDTVCIEVDSPSHLFLAGRSLIPTHNSVLGGCEAICELMLPFSRLAVIAQRYDHVSAEWQYIDRGMRKLFRGAPQAFTRLKYKAQPHYHEYDCDTIWGASGRGFSVESDEGASLLGREFSRVILGEGSHIATDLLERRILRAVDGWLMQSKEGAFREGGYISIYTTPKGYEGCSAAEYERVMKQTGRDPEALHYGRVPFAESVWIREASILENPYYDRRVFEARKRQMNDPAAFEETYLGKMTFKTGRVIKSFESDTHVRPMPDAREIRKMRLGVGIDPGTYKGIVFAGIDRHKRKWALGEVYTQQQTFADTCQEIREAFVAFLAPIRGLPVPQDENGIRHLFDELKESVDVWVIDPAAQDKIDWMSELDVTLSTPIGMEGGKLELLPSVERMDDWFKLGQALVADACDILPDQLRKYAWRQRKAPTRGVARAPVVVEPKKEYDHLIDACRFVWTMLHQMGPTDEAPTPVSFKEAWEHAQRERLFGPLREQMAEARAREGFP